MVSKGDINIAGFGEIPGVPYLGDIPGTDFGEIPGSGFADIPGSGFREIPGTPLM